MIDRKSIEHIAKLARLSLTEDEVTQYCGQLAKALTHFEQISKIDTTGMEPLITPTEIEPYWREDIVEKHYTAEEMTVNAPSKAGNLFKVPPVV